MKILYAVLTAVSLFLPSIAAETEVEVFSTVSCDSRSREILTANRSDVDKVLNWSLETDASLEVLRQLIALAKARVRLPDPAAQHEIKKLVKVEWRKASECWIVSFYFLTGVKEDARSSLMRGTEGIAAVTMLPNGDGVKMVSEPLASGEIKEAGLEPEPLKKRDEGKGPFRPQKK